MEMEEKSTLQEHISYCCDRCNYKSKLHFDIEIHICNPQNNLQDDIGNLKFLLYLEKFKNKICR